MSDSNVVRADDPRWTSQSSLPIQHPLRQVRENLVVGEYFFPFAEKYNPILYSHILSLTNGNSDIGPHNGVVYSKRKTTPDYYKYEEVAPLMKWITSMLVRDFCPSDRVHYHQTTRRPDHQTAAGRRYGEGIRCTETWGLIFERDNEIKPHTHLSNLFTFTYYVKVPKGSAPLVFPTSGKKIKPEEGKLVMFESRLVHMVPANKSDSRCIIGGCFG